MILLATTFTMFIIALAIYKIRKNPPTTVLILQYISLLATLIYGLYFIVNFDGRTLLTAMTNTNLLLLSFTLFIFYIPIYIKDAFTEDFIELYVYKQSKSFKVHLLEHLLEPLFIYIIYLTITFIYLTLFIPTSLMSISIMIGTAILANVLSYLIQVKIGIK